jgi:hypothetical protein
MQAPRPTPYEHIAQARANEALSLRLELSEPDWALTIMFYAALHWVSAYLALVGIFATTHQTRSRAIYSRTELAAIRNHYFFMQDKSEGARYDCVHFSASDIARIRVQNFQPLRETLQRLLGVPP